MTDKIDQKAYAKDCPICFTPSGVPCPHTPIRCEHEFWYGETAGLSGPWRSPPAKIPQGMLRTCELCGLQQRAELTWELKRSSYGSHVHADRVSDLSERES